MPNGPLSKVQKSLRLCDGSKQTEPGVTKPGLMNGIQQQRIPGLVNAEMKPLENIHA